VVGVGFFEGVKPMKNMRMFIFLLVILLTFGLVSCTRSASQSPTSPESEGEGIAEAESTQAVLDVLGENATQTAMAEIGEAKLPESETSSEESEGEGEMTAEEGEVAEEAAPEEVEESVPVETEAPEESAATEVVEEPIAVPEEYGVPNNYVVQRGDSLYCIARRFDLDVGAFVSANGYTLQSQIYPGTKLRIPKDIGSFVGERALRSHPANYTIQYNDTINSIACYYGDVDPRAIEDVNGLSGDYALTPGDVLKIP
jgi:LysM repeat protein